MTVSQIESKMPNDSSPIMAMYVDHVEGPVVLDTPGMVPVSTLLAQLVRDIYKSASVLILESWR